MAGENIMPAEHYPDYFQVVSFALIHTNFDNTTHTTPLMYVEARNANGSGVVIDSVTYGVGVAEAATTMEVIYATLPEATTGTSIHTSTVNVATTGTKTTTIDPSNNFVPSGYWILAKANQNVGQLHCAVTIRFRSRRK